MMPPITTSLPVAERVDVDLDRVLEEVVEEDLAPVGAGSDALEVAGEVVQRVDDLHRAAAEHVARSHEQREADLAAGGERRLDRGRSRVRRRLVAEPGEQLAEASTVLGGVDRVDARAEQAHPRALQPGGQTQRRLAAELHDHALGRLELDHRQHVLERERLEVEAVGGVVVGRDRLRVAVDHHRVAAQLADRHRGVHAAVVELDPLADAVGARAEDHDARPRPAPDLVASVSVGVRALPGGVVVGRARGELGCAGVDRS